VDIAGEVPNQENTSNLKNVKPKRYISLPNLQGVPPSPPSSPLNSSKSNPTSPSSGGSPNVIAKLMKKKRVKNYFQNHPSYQVLDPNFYQRLTISQFHKMEKFFKQFSVMEVDEDPKGEMLNYAFLCSLKCYVFIYINPSCYEEAYTKNLWFKAM